MPKSTIVSPQDGRLLPALDPATLGRPLHLLPRFAALLRTALGQLLEQQLNRRYHAALRLGEPLATLAADGGDADWYAVDDACLGLSLSRRLLLRVLDYRYGGRHAPTALPETLPAPTETERRLARLLAERLAPALAQARARLDDGDGQATVRALPFAPPTAGGWRLQLPVYDGDTALGELRLWLDATSLQQVLRQLGHSHPPADAPRPLADTLRLRLHAQLLHKTLTLEELLALQAGTVLPILLPPQAEVVVGRQRIFTASVAEQHGRLCLTAFKDAE